MKKQEEVARPESAEEEIRQRTDEYRVLHEVAQILHTAEGLEGMLTQTLTALTRFKELEVEYKAGIFLADEEKRVLRLLCTIGDFTQEFLEAEKEIPFGNCLCGRAAVSGEMIISNNCFTDTRHENRFKDMTAHGHYIVPLKSGERMVGILFLYTDENPPWYCRSQEILMSIGGLIADAIVSRQREEDISRKNEELRKLNEIKNQFLGIASHDLRNPLYMIRTFSEALKEGVAGDPTPKQLDLLEKVFNASNFMMKLLENLLDVSKIESGKINLEKKLQNINALATEQVALNTHLAEKKNITFDVKLSDIPFVSFDNGAISQVMSNFITNAVKFSPENTTIKITTTLEEGGVRFAVSDQGPGLSDEDQKLLFQEFQTLSSRPTGGEKSTGLGLAIAKKLINLHQGEIGAISELNRGSEFYFSLPLDTNPSS